LSALRLLKRESVNPALIAAHCMAMLGMIVSIISVVSVVSVVSSDQLRELLYSSARDRATLLSGLLFAELAALSLITAKATRSIWTMVGSSVVFALVASWKLLMFFDLPEVWYGPILACIGMILTVMGRIQSTGNPTQEGSENVSRGPQTPSPWNSVGDVSFILGQLVVFFQTLPWLFGPLGVIPVGSLVAVLFTAGLSAVGSFVAVSAQ
jgi:hypothetical protein